MTDTCPTEETLAAFAAGACDEHQAATIRGHLKTCARCQHWLSDAQGDDSLCRRVVAVLKTYAQDPVTKGPGNLVPPEGEGCFAHAGTVPAVETWIGHIIGDFRVESVLAAGGMGTVYLAQQESPRRPVALKLVKPGLLSRQALRRFEYESQVLARLRHPNIAHVYAAGVHDPDCDGGGAETPIRAVPYFAMEYVPGARTITTYAADRHLTIHERLELFIPVCDAVHHGHQKGIIHRDLKPANILVDETGQVKIIDFGVARSTDTDVAATTLYTEVGQLVGTLQYMSPEQCRADPQDLDTRSDVYSLGVVLYELLCERLPYAVSRTSVVDAARTICEQPADRPSTVLRALRGDLDTIVLKALVKDRTRRYASADALARDLRHHLSGEPIEARPPTAWTRALRWVARHPMLTTAGGCLLIAAVISAATWMAMWFANSRPHHLTWAGDGSEVRLASFADRILHSWQTAQPANGWAGTSTGFVDEPISSGGRRLIVVGLAASTSGPHAGKLCVYDVDGDRTEPIHTAQVGPNDLPSSLSVHKYYQKPSVHFWGVFDVFPDSEGDEVVAVHCIGRFSPRCLRIYDLGLNVLYQVWHDGTIKDCYWLGESDLLICAGDDDEVPWFCRQPEYSEIDWAPQVLFAVRPVRDFVSREFLQTNWIETGSPLHTAWSKCLLPPSSDGWRVRTTRVAAPVPENARGRTLVTVEIVGTDAAVGQISFEIDEQGDEIGGTRYEGSSFRALQSAPNLDVFGLGPLPPIQDIQNPLCQPRER